MYAFNSDREALFSTEPTSWARLDRSVLWRVYSSELQSRISIPSGYKGPHDLDINASTEAIVEWLEV